MLNISKKDIDEMNRHFADLQRRFEILQEEQIRQGQRLEDYRKKDKIQKTTEEMNKRMSASGQGSSHVSPDDHSPELSPRLKLILAIVGVVAVFAVSVVFYMKSGGQKAEMKVPAGQKIIYPENGPPRLESSKL